ncbi:MAG: hypothetical protein IJA61_03670 [Clostridia bacterium]|nr:hypothetical protein [Clostridia bacterium]
MGIFKTLLKYEFKKQFAIKLKKEKSDLFGSILSFVVTIAIIGMFVYFLSIIAENYVNIKIDKLFDSKSRAVELLNLFYFGIFLVLVFLCLENMRKTLTDKTDKQVLLRLPVKQQTLYLSKLLVLMIKNYILSLLFILPTNIIIYLALRPSGLFWLMTIVVCLFFPIVIQLFTSILIVPYIKILDFIKNKYVLMFIVLSVILVGFVLLYMSFLSVVQSYLETGYIKFIFNEEFIHTLKGLLTFAYPINCFSNIMFGDNLLVSFLVILVSVVLACLAVYTVTKRLYYLTLYKSEDRNNTFNKTGKIKKHSLMGGLIKKEFISVAREPKHIFSYLVVATIMPILVYCCYTLFESLIMNMIGLKITYALALFITVVFTVLTNTFCATNITREGVTLLKQKTFPVKASEILNAKLIFCSIVSLLSVLVTGVVLIIFTSLSFWQGVFCIVLGSIFTIAQILLATRVDLNNANMTYSMQQLQKKSSSTVAKVVIIGLVVAIVTGVSALLINVVAKSNLIAGVSLHISFAYLIPLFISLVYCGIVVCFYLHKLQKSFEKIAK